MFGSSSEWLDALEQIAAEVLATTIAPPVDALALARLLGLTVVWDAAQTGRGRIQRLDGQATIFVRPDPRAERVQWTVAHEIGESLIDRLCQRLDVTASELLPRSREELASQLAQRLLLPSEWFWSEWTARADLIRLKERFPTASHELIAWRLLDGMVPRIVTVVDQGVVHRRRCNFAVRSPRVHAAEQAGLERARTAIASAEIDFRWPDGRPARCQAWAIPDDNWSREIAVTTFAPSDDD